MNLAQCLSSTSHRTLIAIARCNGFRAHKGIPKSHLVRWLTDHLDYGDHGADFLHNCQLSERHALVRLALSNGSMPAHDFTRQFGPIRPYRPWRPDSPRHPWRQPVSTSERLLYQGLIFLMPGDQEHQEPPRIVLPDEFLERVAPPISETAPQSAATELDEPIDPCSDMAVLLAYLQGTDVRPFHGRWLALCHVRRVAERLNPPEPVQGARSELQTHRLRFIHYLAESLGLIALTGGHLKPTPAALAWLEMPPSAQWRSLRDTLTAAEDNQRRWQRFRLPGYGLRDPLRFVNRLLEVLTTAFPADCWLPIHHLVDHPRLGPQELIPWWEREEGDAVTSLIEEMLRGPFTSLGVLRLHSSPEGPLWMLTQPGAWLMDREESEPPTDTRTPLSLGEDLRLILPPKGNPAGLLALAGWAEWDPDSSRLRLTPDSIARALAARSACGGDGSVSEGQKGLQDLLATLARYVEPPLSDEQRSTLEYWASQAQIASLRERLILELPDGIVLDQLLSDPSFRPSVKQIITADSAILQGNVGQVVRRLKQRGYHVREVEPDQRTMELEPGGAVWLTTATLVLDYLARRLAVTSVPPSAVVDWLAAHLDLAALASAEQGAVHAIACLNQALDGPAPVPRGMALDETLPIIQDAITHAQPLHLRYWSAWRGEVTERVVEPTRVEWHGDAAYLIGLCHLRHAERTFRLDRVLAIRQCEKAPAA